MLYYVLLSYFVFIIYLFFTATTTTLLYTLSLHDALPILPVLIRHADGPGADACVLSYAQFSEDEEALELAYQQFREAGVEDRKSTRLNSSHLVISYAVFCLKKKKRIKKKKAYDVNTRFKR